MMKKQKINNIKRFAVIIIFSLLMGLGFTVSANEEITLYWNETTRQINLGPGNNWFTIELTDDDGANRHDIYFEVETEGSYHGLYTELYYNNKENLITGDSRDFTSLYCLKHQSAASGLYYLNVHTTNGAYATITTEKFVTSGGAYEPNNRPHFATNIEINQDIILSADLGTYGDDIDYYAYSTTEPCMLTVDVDNGGAELSIYVGDMMIGTTDRREASAASGKLIKSLPYKFNFISGTCYFKVYFGSGNYQLHITKGEYEATPVLYNHSPLNKQIYSEFDVLKPKISVLANGTVTANYLYHKNGESYTSEKKSLTANTKTFTDWQFQNLLPSQVLDTGAMGLNNIQFYVQDSIDSKITGKQTVTLNYDKLPPVCEDVTVDSNEDSIEVTVVRASDEMKLAQKPYRYRIYPAGSVPPNFSEWMTSSYYNMGIDTDTSLAAGIEYVVDVQVRDKVAENCMDASQDLSNHILTVTKTAAIR